MNTALDVLASAAAFFLFASIKSTALVALVLVAQKAFGRFLSAHGRYLLWLALVISLVTPLGFAMRLPSHPALDALAEAPPRQASSALDASSVLDAAPMEMKAAAPVQAAEFRWDIALPLAWLAGVLAVLAAMTVSHRRFAALAHKGTAAPACVQALLRECEQQAGCRTTIRVLASAGLRAPVVSGLYRPVLLWPTGLEALLTPAQLRHVLMHEVMHVKRRDIHGACVVAVLQALHWFNPAIWIAFSALRQDREMACDASTVRALRNVHAHDYAHTLIQLGALRPQLLRAVAGLGILDGRAQLDKRIHMLAQAADPTARHFLPGLLLLAFAGLAFGQPALPPAAVAAGELAPVPVALAERAAAPVVVTKRGPAAVAVVQHASALTPPVAAKPAVAASVAAPAVNDAPAAVVAPEMADFALAPQASVAAEAVQAAVAAPAAADVVLASADTAIAVPATIPAAHASAAAQVAAPAAPPATAPIAQAEQVEVQVCRREATPGSRVVSRICRTEKQWIDAGMQAPRSSAFLRSLYPRDFDGAGNNPPTLLLRGVGL